MIHLSFGDSNVTTCNGAGLHLHSITHAYTIDYILIIQLKWPSCVHAVRSLGTHYKPMAMLSCKSITYSNVYHRASLCPTAWFEAVSVNLDEWAQKWNCWIVDPWFTVVRVVHITIGDSRNYLARIYCTPLFSTCSFNVAKTIITCNTSNHESTSYQLQHQPHIHSTLSTRNLIFNMI